MIENDISEEVSKLFDSPLFDKDEKKPEDKAEPELTAYQKIIKWLSNN